MKLLQFLLLCISFFSAFLLEATNPNFIIDESDLPEWARGQKGTGDIPSNPEDTQLMNSILNSDRLYDAELQKYYYLIKREEQEALKTELQEKFTEEDTVQDTEVHHRTKLF